MDRANETTDLEALNKLNPLLVIQVVGNLSKIEHPMISMRYSQWATPCDVVNF